MVWVVIKCLSYLNGLVDPRGCDEVTSGKRRCVCVCVCSKGERGHPEPSIPLARFGQEGEDRR